MVNPLADSRWAPGNVAARNSLVNRFEQMSINRHESEPSNPASMAWSSRRSPDLIDNTTPSVQAPTAAKTQRPRCHPFDAHEDEDSNEWCRNCNNYIRQYDDVRELPCGRLVCLPCWQAEKPECPGCQSISTYDRMDDEPVLNSGDECDDEDSDENEEPTCSICLEIPKTDDKTVTPCGHMFCYDCITQALNNAQKCPLCRAYCTYNDLRLSDPCPATSYSSSGSSCDDQDDPALDVSRRRKKIRMVILYHQRMRKDQEARYATLIAQIGQQRKAQQQLHPQQKSGPFSMLWSVYNASIRALERQQSDLAAEMERGDDILRYVQPLTWHEWEEAEDYLERNSAYWDEIGD